MSGLLAGVAVSLRNRLPQGQGDKGLLKPRPAPAHLGASAQSALRSRDGKGKGCQAGSQPGGESTIVITEISIFQERRMIWFRLLELRRAAVLCRKEVKVA